MEPTEPEEPQFPRKLGSRRTYPLRQSQQEQQAIIEQIEEMAIALPKKRFIALTSGTQQDGYADALYHIGQIWSRSFFITYQFLPEKGMTAEKLAKYVFRTQDAQMVYIGLKQSPNPLNEFFVMTWNENPYYIRIYSIKHPDQHHWTPRVTWRPENLGHWIRNHSTGIPTNYYRTEFV